MPTVDPASYSWLSDSALQVAGCVTVVPDSAPEPVARAFGHDPGDPGDEPGPGTFAERSLRGDLGDDGSEIWVAATAGATVVFEFNGFEGTRDEVLREASKIGPAKLAASIFWNVNGLVQVTCARRGKVVASIDLYLDEDELDEVPRALRKLARLCFDDEADLEAIGAAMVETYVGVGFTQADLEGSVCLPIVSRSADLQTYVNEPNHYRPLDYTLPGVQDVVHAMPPQHQRALAEWAALAAVREAGLSDEPAVRAALDQFGSGERVVLPPGLEALKRRAAAEADRQDRLVNGGYDESASGAISVYHARIPGSALEAVRWTSHTDPFSAAVGALAAAASTYTCARLDRDPTSGPDWLQPLASPSRLGMFEEVVSRVVAADPTTWDDLARLLPAPLSAAELATAAATDKRWQEAGAFTVWQSTSADGKHTSGHWPQEAVMERYRELEARDLAMAARGPIAVEVVEPENAGGFAVQLSDGLRIERLPVGRAAGRLWLAFVFTNEFGIGHDRRGPSDRVSYEGPSGLIRTGGGGHTAADGSYSHWRVDFSTDGLPWLKLNYLDQDDKKVASETIELA